MKQQHPYRLVMAISGTLYRTEPKTMTYDDAQEWVIAATCAPGGEYLHSLERLETTTAWVLV